MDEGLLRIIVLAQRVGCVVRESRVKGAMKIMQLIVYKVELQWGCRSKCRWTLNLRRIVYGSGGSRRCRTGWARKSEMICIRYVLAFSIIVFHR
jgi:hypothetical protein